MISKWLIIDGTRTFIETYDGALSVSSDDVIASTPEELVNLLRVKGHQVDTDPKDDGGINIWYIFARNPSFPDGEEIWYALTEQAADRREITLKSRHPHLIGWRQQQYRLTRDAFATLNEQAELSKLIRR